MKLQVKVLRATELSPKDFNGKSDPFCAVYLGGTDARVYRTDVSFSTLEPTWNETFVFYASDLGPFLHTFDGLEFELSGYLVLDMWDHDTMNPDDFMGQVMIPLREVPLVNPQEEWYPLRKRNVKDQIDGAVMLEVSLSVDKKQIVNKNLMNSYLYRRCKLRGYHLPIMSGKERIEIPGHTERVEMAFSDVFVNVSSVHFVAQVYLTNYRLVILSNNSPRSGRHTSSNTDLSTWVALNNIICIETGYETVIFRKQHSKQKLRTMSIHCYDVRIIKLIFTMDENKHLAPITTIPEVTQEMEKNGAVAVQSHQFRFMQKKMALPAITKKFKPCSTEMNKSKQHQSGPLWHVHLDIARDSKRTQSEGIATSDNVETSNLKERLRSRSGDSLSNKYSIGATLVKMGVACAGMGDKSMAQANEVTTQVGGVKQTSVKVEIDGVFEDLANHGKSSFVIDNQDKSIRQSDVRLSKSLDDVSLMMDHGGDTEAKNQCHSNSPAYYSDFCVLDCSEPTDLAGREYVVFDESELIVSVDDGVDGTMDVKDLTPANSTLQDKEEVKLMEVGRKRSTSASPPKANAALLQVFEQRLESIIINSVAFPPGLFFVQLFKGNLQLTGWEIYNFPKEMDRQEVSDDLWRLSVQNGPEYQLCSTYPQLMYVPNAIEDSVILESAHFRSKNRLPCLVWVDSKRKNFMLRSAQPLAGKFQKHSLQDEQLIEACLNAGPPDAHMIIYDARSSVAATGNMLKGMGTENITRYPRAKLTYLDIPNIHVVRESYDSLRSLCLSSESSKWYSSLENTQWLTNLGIIIKGATMIARYMKLQRGNALVHCSDGWDRTSQLTSLAQLLMDPYYRTFSGFMVLVEKEWLVYGHKFQHRLGHPDFPSERSPIFLQFLDCVQQILRLFPKSFEFKSSYLLRIAEHLNSGWFGTFLCNCDRERHHLSLYARSPSLWAHLLADKEIFLNKDYYPSKQPTYIFPSTNLRHLNLWEEYFLRHDSSHLDTQGISRVSETRFRQSSHYPQRTISSNSDYLQESWTTDHVIWIADDQIKECMFCHSKFNPFRRKHHCRACGNIFCDDCTKNKVALVHLGYTHPERVCVECSRKLNAAQRTSDGEDGFLLISCSDTY